MQLPPHFRANPVRLDAFLRAAPRRLCWAVEVRDPRWLTSEVYAVLEQHGAALCIHDLIERHPRVVTADFVYQRFHGQDYGGSYPHQALSAEAARIAGYAQQGLDVYAYFNNGRGGHAVQNAMDLRRYVERRLRQVALIPRASTRDAVGLLRSEFPTLWPRRRSDGADMSAFPTVRAPHCP